MSYRYESILCDEMTMFMSMVESSSLTTRRYEGALKSLDQFLIANNHNEKSLPYRIVFIWLDSMTCRAATKNNLISCIRVFARYLMALDIQAYEPEYIRGQQSEYIPYTFSDEEIVRLFEAADNFKTIKREGWPSNMVFPMILRILYCCGLRVGEALNLTWEDVDLKTGVIRIKQAKNDRQRNVPMDPSLTEILKQYKRQRYGVENSTSYIFESPKNPGHPYLVWTVRSWFIHALDAAGIDVSRSKKFEHTISPHTLRHFFAYKSFLQAERSGLSLEQFAPYLSSYLGHASLLETEKYISTDYTLYKDSHDRVNVAISHVFPEVDFDE
jgi:integrase